MALLPTRMAMSEPMIGLGEKVEAPRPLTLAEKRQEELLAFESMPDQPTADEALAIMQKIVEQLDALYESRVQVTPLQLMQQKWAEHVRLKQQVNLDITRVLFGDKIPGNEIIWPPAEAWRRAGMDFAVPGRDQTAICEVKQHEKNPASLRELLAESLLSPVVAYRRNT